jgi:cytochrome oxidase Cu insertion factor (SCO1/SenC/PrrC family)
VLKAYAQRYNYDPAHWSFLTGPADKVAELASLSDVNFDREGGFYNHNFRTLIIDPTGELRMTFPVTGDIADAIAEEILKALRPLNRSAPSPGPE